MYSTASIVASPNEYPLPWPSHVQISKVQFAKELNSRFLGATGWDGSLRLFHVGTVGYSEQKAEFYLGKPQLACTFATGSRLACGGFDNAVSIFDLETKTGHKLGSHNQPVRCLEYNPRGDVLVSGGWDASIKLWDCRGPGTPLQTAMVSEKVYAMSVHDDTVVVGTRDKKIYVFDQRNLTTPLHVNDSPLKYQIRSIAIEPAGNFFVVSSIEGRIAVEYFQTADKSKSYAFKAHRETNEEGVEMIYPVNAIDFHPYHGTFATGGSDTMVNIWDPINRKRLVQFHKYVTTVCSLAFNFDGSQLAIANSYLGELSADPVPKPPNQIIVRSVSDLESRPKCVV